MKEGFNSEEFNREIENNNLELSENGVLLILNKEGEKVESIQFKELVKTTGNPEKAKQAYNRIKELENGDLKESKLRDENGELMIVWHGSPRKFEEFNPKAKGEYRWRNQGTHFQSSKETVEQYAKKANRAWGYMAYNIGLEYFGLKDDSDLTDKQDKKAKEIYNEIIEDLIKNGEESKFFRKGFEDHFDFEKKIMEKHKRTPALDAIIYGKHQFGTEWVLEIFGGEMPTKENCSFNKKYGTYFGNDIGEYKYAAVLDIEKPFSEESKEIDHSFELGEKSHREQNTDGTILTHPENVKGMGNLEIPNTKGTYSVAVFDENKIKIIGIETENGFEINKEFMEK